MRKSLLAYIGTISMGFSSTEISRDIINYTDENAREIYYEKREQLQDDDVKLAVNLYWSRLIIVARPLRVAVC